MKFRPVIEALEEFCGKRSIRHAVVGAFGLAAYGLQRQTRDLDILIEDRDHAALSGFLESLGYETLQRTTAFSVHSHPLREMGRVDLIQVDEATAGEVFRRARPRKMIGRTVLVPCPEHLAAMKIQAMANDPTRVPQDFADLHFILAIPGIDREEVRSHFARFDLLDRYEEICRRLTETL